jgi:diaminopimelate decarboxylase
MRPVQRPPAFRYRRDALCAERVAMERLAARFGTPLYVYSAGGIRARLRDFDRAFASLPHTICYSVKANPCGSVLALLAGLGAGFDVVSGGEMERVLRAAPGSAARVVFSGVGKTAAEMDAALRAGILLFNVESEGELELLAARAQRMRRRARVALRVNPDVPAATHPYISTGLRDHKFGVPMEQAARLYRRAAALDGLEVAGVSLHIGSQIRAAAPFAAAMRRVAGLVQGLRAAGHAIRYLDAGGGLGISYGRAPGHEAQEIRRYARTIAPAVERLGAHLILEPGRAIVGAAGALLTRVLYVKTNGRKRFVIVDAAMNDLIRPSLYGAHHEVAPVRPRPGRAATVDVAGPVCETGDFFARDRRLPPLEPGDLVAVLDAGAYGMSLASNYNSRPRAAEVLVEGSRVRLARRRETLRDLLRNETDL